MKCQRCAAIIEVGVWCSECKKAVPQFLQKQERDERLHDAAPEMLELLQEFTECDNWEWGNRKGHIQQIDCEKCIPCEVRALIAKIEG